MRAGFLNCTVAYGNYGRPARLYLCFEISEEALSLLKHSRHWQGYVANLSARHMVLGVQLVCLQAI